MSHVPANLPSPGPEISRFEAIKHRDEHGHEFWYARELMTLLGYKKWQHFHDRVIQEAIAICAQEGPDAVESNFTAIGKVSPNGKNTYQDYQLSRHACYLIAESADGRKDEVAWAKIYFAFTTERYELMAQSEEDALRIEARQKLALHHAELALRAKMAGATTPAHFEGVFNAGLRGLYEGETAAKIRQRRRLKPTQDIYSYMGSLETVANDMRAALAVHHVDQRGVTDLPGIARTHNEAGKAVRRFLESEGVNINELPMPSKSYEQLVREAALREMLAEQDRTGLWTQLPGADDDTEES
jgi:DNA-damage-inducible protein D